MIILDTCALLWLVNSPERLSDRAASTIQANPDELAVVSISVWEIAIKAAKGGLLFPEDLPPYEWYARVKSAYGLIEFPLEARTLCLAADLPPVHGDPCDRMIIATAAENSLPIVTADEKIRHYPDVRVIW